MSRFTSGLSKIREATGKPTAIPAEPATAATERVSELPPSRQGKVAISAYFDSAVRKQLAILAAEEDRSQAALMAEALNLLFERYGKSPIARA